MTRQIDVGKKLKMCGVAGLVHKDSKPVQQFEIIQMLDPVVHRGPDDRGVYCDSNLGLGHQRLSIQDLSAASAQPMISDCGRFVLIYNGEVYNFREIRGELQSRRHRFRSQGDTEVVLKAYQEWGDAAVEKFNGMWAFVIFDKIKRRLFCSRDRFGIKPFYYIDSNSLFAFASEIKQLTLLHKSVMPNLSVISEFLSTSYLPSNEETFFQQIKSLPSGHNLFFTLDSGDKEIRQYHSLNFRSEINNCSIDEANESYMDLLESSIDLRMRSDVKIGTCLSGGLDSSTIATMGEKMKVRGRDGNKFFAITASNSEIRNDETNYAEIIVKNVGLEWSRVMPSYEQFESKLNDLAFIQDEPFGSPSIFMQYFVMEEAKKQGVKVLLDGQGGDESLLGYDRHYPLAILAGNAGLNPFQVLNTARQILKNNSNMSIFKLLLYIADMKFKSVRHLRNNYRHRYLRPMQILPNHEQRMLPELNKLFDYQKYEILISSLPALLRYEDRNSMFHSIETRLPFMDYRLVEFSLSLPVNLKIRKGWSKWLLRSIMQEKMPESIVWRKSKKGFDAPEETWLSQHYLNMYNTVMGSELLKSICNMTQLKKIFPTLDRKSQWRLYSTALWEKAYSL